MGLKYKCKLHLFVKYVYFILHFRLTKITNLKKSSPLNKQSRLSVITFSI
jgi:hypothetical protein